MKMSYRLIVALVLGLTLAGGFCHEVRAEEPAQEESTLRWLRRRMRVPTFHEKRHNSVLSAYESCIRQARLATVTIKSSGDEIALGTIVRSDGYILTKASELKDDPVCILSDGRRRPATVVGIQRQYDLAMLHIDANELPVIEWSESEPEVGSLLATAGSDKYPLSVGVVSAEARTIRSPSGVLGVMLRATETGAEVERVLEGSSAEAAGVEADDVITSVNGEAVKTREELIQLIAGYLPGDQVLLEVTREEQDIELKAVLGDRNALHGQTPLYVQNTLGGPISGRRSGFPRAIQHDTVLEPHQCGGPVVDLNGHAIGLNIARAGRVASYAIPAGEIQSMIGDFIDGTYAPHESVAQVKAE